VLGDLPPDFCHFLVGGLLGANRRLSARLLPAALGGGEGLLQILDEVAAVLYAEG
jgi:hypothetical protein